MAQARFHIGPVYERTAGHYTCVYEKGFRWSPCSKTLELKVTSEDVIPTPGSAVTSGLFQGPWTLILTALLPQTPLMYLNTKDPFSHLPQHMSPLPIHLRFLEI